MNLHSDSYITHFLIPLKRPPLHESKCFTSKKENLALKLHLLLVITEGPLLTLFFETLEKQPCRKNHVSGGVIYRGSPPYAHFGTWKKLCYMKSVLVGLHCGPLLALIPPLTRT